MKKAYKIKVFFSSTLNIFYLYWCLVVL
jgi:hypothetical protein